MRWLAVYTLVWLAVDVYFGPAELWIGPLITALALVPMIASVALILRQHRSVELDAST